MKRRLARTAVLLATATILLLYPLLAPPAHRIDPAHLRMIKGGMTQAEVEAIFGVPAGEYDWTVSTTPRDWAHVMAYSSAAPGWNPNTRNHQRVVFLENKQPAFLHGSWNNPDHGRMAMWTSRHGAFYVIFDHQGGVMITGSTGETRREFPWRRWWRQWRGE